MYVSGLQANSVVDFSPFKPYEMDLLFCIVAKYQIY